MFGWAAEVSDSAHRAVVLAAGLVQLDSKPEA